jgi:hypothetical protein
MPTTDDKKEVVSGHAEFTVEELIRSQLEGKSKALERYDDILWKIRAGYLAVLYGLLTILSGKEFQLTDLIGNLPKIDILLYTAISFSLCAFFIDLGFLLSKLRVVQDRNDLSDLALDLALKKTQSEKVKGSLRILLQLSGEAPVGPGLKLFLNGVWPIIFLYLTTPLMIALFRAHFG